MKITAYVVIYFLCCYTVQKPVACQPSFPRLPLTRTEQLRVPPGTENINLITYSLCDPSLTL
jgi:hypothetical protein